MTVQELKQLFYLDKLIEAEKERLEDLRAAADVHSPALTDMPKAPGAKDKLGAIVPQIADQEAELEENIRRYDGMRKSLLDYINTLPNARIKLIMIKRFIQRKSWQEVADEIGGRETEYSVKSACYRYMSVPEDPDWKKNQISMFDDSDTSGM